MSVVFSHDVVENFQEGFGITKVCGVVKNANDKKNLDYGGDRRVPADGEMNLKIFVDLEASPTVSFSEGSHLLVFKKRIL